MYSPPAARLFQPWLQKKHQLCHLNFEILGEHLEHASVYKFLNAKRNYKLCCPSWLMFIIYNCITIAIIFHCKIDFRGVPCFRSPFWPPCLSFPSFLGDGVVSGIAIGIGRAFRRCRRLKPAWPRNSSTTRRRWVLKPNAPGKSWAQLSKRWEIGKLERTKTYRSLKIMATLKGALGIPYRFCVSVCSYQKKASTKFCMKKW